ncbi:penicillin-binding protein activator [Glacieibacterium frigidum]|uniref:Penicillin-binding protein activator n=1 Tax=Glacieibacterium frigidum TaxID=2593303 RepID=A0A552UEX5_9SPHN|nr:penicillin-binding protein activator [Glacieibacterium frigidum]TRW16763.1 penicillin-binding protein activator [Glacieibacterium frigidum]
MRIVNRFGRRLQLASGIAIALLVSGCTRPAARVATVNAPPPVERPVEAPVAPPVAAPQNRVALLVPLSGANAAVGQSIANAANMALLESGERRINLRIYDTAGGAAAAASKAVNEGARLFLGPLLAGDVRAVQGVASANSVPVLSFSNDAALAGEGTYVLGYQPGQSIARVVQYARGRGAVRFAALIPDGVYGQRAANAFLRAVEASGGRVVSVVNYARTPAKLLAAARSVTDYDRRMARAAKAPALRPDGSVAPIASRLPPVGFQALLIADSGPVAAAFGPALTQYGAGGVLVLGTELWNNEPAIRNARGLQGAVFASVADGRFAALSGRYREKFGGTPSRLASFGYDSVLLVNSLADRWPVGQPFPRALLAAPDGFAGIDGVFRFTGAGIADRGLEVQRIAGGTITTVQAAPKTLGGGR